MDQETIVLMQAIMTDEAKQKRLAEITAAMADLDKKRLEIAALQDQANTTRAEAEALRRASAADRQAAEDKTASLADWEKRLGEVDRAQNLEKIRFEEVRTKVERDHSLREEKLANGENSIDEAEKKVMAREAAATIREAALEQGEAAHNARVGRLKAALGEGL